MRTTLRTVTGATKVTLRINWGPPGQYTPHVHVHLVPRYVGDGHDGFMPCPMVDVGWDSAEHIVKRMGLRLARTTEPSNEALTARPIEVSSVPFLSSPPNQGTRS